ncbi:MAG: RluA family pseudouridine synthase [Oscillospiraceae bacterium]|nr:RluA family pseudouridine synthase [Oscillospiraceae bacterium]
MKSIVIKKNDEGQRLDKFLTKSFPNLPVSIIYKSIRKKRIKINNKRCEASDKLVVGDILSLYINDEFLIDDPDINFLSACSDLEIIFEDENILLINKPAGLLVHEDENQKVDTLINRIKKYLYDKKEYDINLEMSFAPALVHRLDRNTQGLVIAAKNSEALRILNQKFKDREIKKYYLCLVHGVLKNKSGILKNYLIKNESENRVYVFQTPRQDSKIILTKYKVLKVIDNISLLEIELLTGRTHQIRAHMAYINHPLVGDTKYGTAKINQDYNLKHQALVSYKLTFDFKTDAGVLNYLKNRSFEIKDARNNIFNIIN